MTLNFWPFNCAARRLRKESDQHHAERLAELRVAFAEKGGAVQPFMGPTSCAECGGLFVENKLKPVTVITVFSPAKSVVVTERYLCPRCQPTANLEVKLESSSGTGGNLDTAYFSTQEGYLQPFSFDDVEQTLIPADEFGLLYCGECDNLINTKRKCRKCSTKPRRR